MTRSESSRIALIAMSALLALGAPRPSVAQAGLDLGGAVLAEGEAARYLRLLSLVDTTAIPSGSIQPVGRRTEAGWRHALVGTAHPWAPRLAAAHAAAERRGSLSFRLLRPDAELLYLSDRPLPRNDGVVWAGRGATVSAQAGAAFEWRWIRAQLAPVVFAAQNADFALLPNGADVPERDPRFAFNIDLPQRFGSGGYSRFDWGDSFVELELAGAMLGFSNARQHWGPAVHYPLVLGTGSGGFAHVQMGTAAPLRTPIGSVRIRSILGRLEQSAYSPVQTGATARFLSGVVGSYVPRPFPGLEVGATRIINGPWPAGGVGVEELLRPFEGVLNDNAGSINANLDNGFASAFVRIAPPGSGIEAYGELSREDFAGDLRQLILEPDDLVHYTIGLARAVPDAAGMRTLRLEYTNGEVSHFERGSRGLDIPLPPYLHGGTPQGLTNRGQLLGSFGAYGGAAATLSWERHDATGRRRWLAERLLVHDWIRPQGTIGGVRHGEVRYALRHERLRFRRGADISLSAGLSYTLNRGVVEGRDVLGVELGARWRGW